MPMDIGENVDVEMSDYDLGGDLDNTETGK